MTRILFVCHGNICRSPMAEFILKDMLEQECLSSQFQVDSAATSSEEIYRGIGNPIYPTAKRTLQAHGLCSKQMDDKRARQLERADYDRYDRIIAMDHKNMRGIMHLFASDPEGKISMMMDHTDDPGDVADPWYTGDFEQTFNDIREGCHALLENLLENMKQST